MLARVMLVLVFGLAATPALAGWQRSGFETYNDYWTGQKGAADAAKTPAGTASDTQPDPAKAAETKPTAVSPPAASAPEAKPAAVPAAGAKLTDQPVPR